ncbi:MAG: hypothetical protein WC076_06320 [Terrimicrobiaceae bacterium]|jgi:hypothetical protein|nr:hypothetical protein [Terrimicrobiaceae bacterium]
MPALTEPLHQAPPAGTVSEAQLLQAIKSIDWDAHWREVIEIMSVEAKAYEQARARSMEGAAQRVFL